MSISNFPSATDPVQLAQQVQDLLADGAIEVEDLQALVKKYGKKDPVADFWESHYHGHGQKLAGLFRPCYEFNGELKSAYTYLAAMLQKALPWVEQLSHPKVFPFIPDMRVMPFSEFLDAELNRLGEVEPLQIDPWEPVPTAFLRQFAKNKDPQPKHTDPQTEYGKGFYEKLTVVMKWIAAYQAAGNGSRVRDLQHLVDLALHGNLLEGIVCEVDHVIPIVVVRNVSTLRSPDPARPATLSADLTD